MFRSQLTIIVKKVSGELPLGVPSSTQSLTSSSFHVRRRPLGRQSQRRHPNVATPPVS